MASRKKEIVPLDRAENVIRLPLEKGQRIVMTPQGDVATKNLHSVLIKQAHRYLMANQDQEKEAS